MTLVRLYVMIRARQMRSADDRTASANSAEDLGTAAVAPDGQPSEEPGQGGPETREYGTEGARRRDVNLRYDALPGELAEDEPDLLTCFLCETDGPDVALSVEEVG